MGHFAMRQKYLPRHARRIVHPAFLRSRIAALRRALLEDRRTGPRQALIHLGKLGLVLGLNAQMLDPGLGAALAETLGIGLAVMLLFALLDFANLFRRCSEGRIFTERNVKTLRGGGDSLLLAAAASALVPPERRGSALAIVMGGMTVAFLMGIPLGSVVGAAFGWRAPFLLSAGLSASASLPPWLSVPKIENPNR